MRPGGERFTIVQPLGSGGMGVVYRARDELHGHEVALKTLSGHSGRDLYRFKREFRALADLNHPNLCQLHELHTAAGQWFFTMELIDGVTFLDWVRPLVGAQRGPLLADRLAGAMRQLIDGVLALHHAGKLHRDLKPSNVMVTPAGRVVLLDFGLVAGGTNDEHTHEAAAVGTPTYMSPEQAADRTLTEASDWYSVGVMLYEALTARRPFEGTPQHVLLKKQSEPPLPPGAHDPTVPPDLELLCLDLLAVDPAQRPDAARILRAFGGAPSRTTDEIARGARRAPFVGRATELATLDQAWRDARAGEVTVVVIRGESGIGKSALVRELRRRVAAEALVLVGRCYDRETLPFKALDPIVDELTTALLALPAGEAKAVVPPEIAALARLFPVLRRVPAVADHMVFAQLPTDPLALRSRAFGGLRALLRALGQTRPILIAIDDLQWGDADSAAVLVDLIHNPEPLPLLLVLIHRHDDEGGVVDRVITPSASFASGAARLISLGPLTDVDARTLVASLGAGDQTTEIAVREAHGHPMFLTELVRSPRTDAGAATVEDVIRGRLAALPPSATAILRVLAVATHPVPVTLALRAAGADVQSRDVSHLRTEHLARARQHGDEGEARLEPYHDRVRRAVLAELGAGEPAIHAALARALELAGARDHEALITHWIGAGDPGRAATYATAAAAAASDQLAFHRAAELYQLALDHGRASPDEQRQLYRRLAGALVSAGQLLAAATAFAAAANGAPPDERLELDQRRLEQLLRGGAVQDGMALARDVLARVGHHLPVDDRSAIRAVVIERLRITLRGLGFKPVPETELAPGLIQRLDTLRSVATSITLGNPIHGRLIQFQFLRAALDAGELRRVCIALTYEVGYASQGGSRTIARQDKLLALLYRYVERSGDPQLAAISDVIAGIARYLAGRFRDARELLERGTAGLREHGVGNTWELDVGTSFLLGVLFHLGETRLLARQVPGLLREASERGDVFAQRALRGWRGNVAWLIAGRPTAARTHVQAAAAASTDDAFTVQRYYELYSHTQIDLYEREVDEASRRLDDAAPKIAGGHLLRVESIRIELAYLRGRVAVARGAPIAALAREIKLLRKERSPVAAAYALQLEAAVLHLRGDRAGALAALAGCEERFAACHMMLMATIARWRHAALDGSADAGARVTAAIDSIAAGAVADPVALARMLWPWPE